MSDPVNKPSHYNAGEVETIDGIRAALGDGFADYCKGNVLKYVWRCGKKGDAVEDLKKAAKYLEWAIEAMEGNCPVIPDSSERRLRQCCSPIAIPAGWRELEPDEVPLATDMHEWMGGWYYRNCDATHEYKWHSSRHIRKIESDNPGHVEGVWVEEASPFDGRKIEPTQWIPKVGDKVRVLTFGRIASRYECVITEAADGKYTVEHLNLVSKNLEAKELEPIEAAP